MDEHFFENEIKISCNIGLYSLINAGGFCKIYSMIILLYIPVVKKCAVSKVPNLTHADNNIQLPVKNFGWKTNLPSCIT